MRTQSFRFLSLNYTFYKRLVTPLVLKANQTLLIRQQQSCSLFHHARFISCCSCPRIRPEVAAEAGVVARLKRRTAETSSCSRCQFVRFSFLLDIVRAPPSFETSLLRSPARNQWR